VAVTWTRAHVQVRKSWLEAGPDAWLPADDIRMHDIPNPAPVLARIMVSTGSLADVSGLAPAQAITRAGVPVAVRVHLEPAP
jgi:hypothetical protein